MKDARFWPDMDDFVSQIGETVQQRRLCAWLLSTDCDDAAELERLRKELAAAQKASSDGGAQAKELEMLKAALAGRCCPEDGLDAMACSATGHHSSRKPSTDGFDNEDDADVEKELSNDTEVSILGEGSSARRSPARRS